MSVYVDWLIDEGYKVSNKSSKTCSMYADSKEELVEFAKQLGIDNDNIVTHKVVMYRLSPLQREQALDLGALDTTHAGDWLKVFRAAKQQAKDLNAET